MTPIDPRSRGEILNQLARFARVVDAKDWDAVSDVFADDVVFDYGDLGEERGIVALRDQFRRYLDNCGATQHLIGSIILNRDGDHLVSRAYVQARHQGAGGRADRFLDTNGEYVDRWEERPEGWRIVRRDAVWAIHMGDFSILMPEDAAATHN
jgi:ketosteroid isomerase-like protein|tara:strand:- start:10487 stop:10945 length:459 start_codon:yes stop_codon:yes gene_type:complete